MCHNIVTISLLCVYGDTLSYSCNIEAVMPYSEKQIYSSYCFKSSLFTTEFGKGIHNIPDFQYTLNSTLKAHSVIKKVEPLTL